MREAARVLDATALDDAKAALAEHAETIKSIFIGVDADVQRLDGWLAREAPMYWKQRIRALDEEVLRAKARIAAKRLAAAPEPANIVEETIALRKVLARLEHAQAKAARVKHWTTRWRQEAPLYRAACRSVVDWANRDALIGIARLSLMLRRLEEYRRLVPVRPGEPPTISSDFFIDPEEDAAAEPPASPPDAPDSGTHARKDADP